MKMRKMQLKVFADSLIQLCGEMADWNEIIEEPDKGTQE